MQYKIICHSFIAVFFPSFVRKLKKMNAAIRMTAKSESLPSNRPDNKHMNVWELYILDTIDWNVEAKPTLLLWETISILNEILAMAFEFWQPDISHDIQLFKEGTNTSSTHRHCII
jgi:hypothetical protein